MSELRAKNPRVPAISLSNALDRVLRVYEKEGRHPIANDVAAVDIGYASADSGPARTALASLKYFGLLVDSGPQSVAVSQDVESFKYTQDEREKSELLAKWVSNPKVYSELLAVYSTSLPSAAAIKHQFIKMGFSPKNVDSCVKNFLESVEFSRYYASKEQGFPSVGEQGNDDETKQPIVAMPQPSNATGLPGSVDRIPVRLAGGRRALIEIPQPFYEKDKEVIKNFVDLIVVDD